MAYSISDLEQLSGVHAHTIRIWEQRYGALTPMRTEGNTRIYDDEQLRKLLNIVSLNKSGIKISKICNLSDQAFNQLLNQQLTNTATDDSVSHLIAELIRYGLSFDGNSFDRLIDEAVDELGFSDCYRKIIYPLLVRLGLMWRKDDICPAHEHFLSNIIRQKLFSHINSLPMAAASANKWLLFLPEDEDHDIGLLFACYMLRMHGHQVVFLGSKVPLTAIKRVFSSLNADQVLLFLVKSRQATVTQQYIDQLSEICTPAQIHLAGNSKVIGMLKNVAHITWFKTLDEFEMSIQNINLHEKNF